MFASETATSLDPSGPAHPPAEDATPIPGYGTEVSGRFRYRLVKRLGGGAFGSVFFARCLDAETVAAEGPPERVAVKILARGASAARVQLLRRELSALRALRHDRIPSVYDWSLEGPLPFLAMEYHRAGDLRDVLARGGSVPEAMVWRLLRDLLSALVAAHRASILHLDIKPANVLLDGKDGFVLTDFGVSQTARIRHGILPSSLGTPGYQAPEQRKGRFDCYDVRTDLWGVGATAWALLTGIHLSDRTQLVRDATSGSTYGLPPVSQFRIYCAPALEDVIMSMLVLDQSKRPGSAAEVLARVQAQLDAGLEAPAGSVPARRGTLAEAEVKAVIDGLVDPFWASLIRSHGLERFFATFEDGERLCAEGERSYHAFLLLRGRVRVEREGVAVGVESREGSFLGEVATLSGRARTASLFAEGPVCACVFNAAELDEFVTSHPAVGVRLLRAMAERLARQG
jgi:tRNA A-37 threonylcarbamoyl transferase component Bud32